MTVTVNPTQPASPPERPPHRRRLVAVIGATTVAAAGLGIGLGVGLSGSTTPSATSTSAYSYYQSVMGRYGLDAGSMMGGNYGWMMGQNGYGWMMGGTAAPGWMAGGTLPGFMMGNSSDPGKVMGSLFANAPGPRVTAAEGSRLGDQVPAGATVDRAASRLTFTTSNVHFAVVASPTMPAENFRIAGMTNPTIVVPAGSKVTIEFINADEDMAHGLVVTASGAASSRMPMMTAAPAFPGAALWFLGDSTSAGMHEGTISFTATTPGNYQYLCPIPDHAQEGMVGNLTVAS